jgi:hypothetical protein
MGPPLLVELEHWLFSIQHSEFSVRTRGDRPSYPSSHPAFVFFAVRGGGLLRRSGISRGFRLRQGYRTSPPRARTAFLPPSLRAPRPAKPAAIGERPRLSRSPFPVPCSRLSPLGERPQLFSDPRKGLWGIPTIPTGYTLGYTRRCQKPSNRPLRVSNSVQVGPKRRQNLAKRPLPILTFGRKTALALAPRPIHPLGGYQKWGISPNRVYYSERDTMRYYSIRAPSPRREPRGTRDQSKIRPVRGYLNAPRSLEAALRYVQDQEKGTLTRRTAPPPYGGGWSGTGRHGLRTCPLRRLNQRHERSPP